MLFYQLKMMLDRDKTSAATWTRPSTWTTRTGTKTSTHRQVQNNIPVHKEYILLQIPQVQTVHPNASSMPLHAASTQTPRIFPAASTSPSCLLHAATRSHNAASTPLPRSNMLFSCSCTPPSRSCTQNADAFCVHSACILQCCVQRRNF